MTLNSSIETVAILYDIENAPFEMLDYTLGKARKYLPCRMIIQEIAKAVKVVAQNPRHTKK